VIGVVTRGVPALSYIFTSFPRSVNFGHIVLICLTPPQVDSFLGNHFLHAVLSVTLLPPCDDGPHVSCPRGEHPTFFPEPSRRSRFFLVFRFFIFAIRSPLFLFVLKRGFHRLMRLDLSSRHPLAMSDTLPHDLLLSCYTRRILDEVSLYRHFMGFPRFPFLCHCCFFFSRPEFSTSSRLCLVRHVPNLLPPHFFCNRVRRISDFSLLSSFPAVA